MRSHAGILATVAAGPSLLLHALLFSASRSIRIPIAAASIAAPEEEAMLVVYAPQQPESEYTIGEADAKGYASHKVEGTREAIAPEAPVDQAALSLDPVGPDLVVERPAKSVGDRTGQPSTLAQGRATLAQLLDSARARLPQVAEALRERATSGEFTSPSDRPTAPPVPAPVAPASTPTPPVPTGVAVAGGEADPAPMSDSESDPFSVLGSAEYRDGRLSVRAGRKVKSRRPRIGLAGQVDLYQRKGAQVTLRVATDAAGKVTGVEIVKSSGSNEIDQPCLVAMYDWWFEPKKDKSGNPIADRFDFTIGFH